MMMFLTQWLRLRQLGLAVACGWLLADQFSKMWALKTLAAGPLVVVPRLFDLHLAFNRGVSFSLLADMPAAWLPWVLTGFAVLVSALLAHWLGQNKFWVFQLGVGSIMAGALGNSIDRLRFGVVIDFLDVHYQTVAQAGAQAGAQVGAQASAGQYAWVFPTFNVADVAINIGVGLLLLDALIQWRYSERT